MKKAQIKFGETFGIIIIVYLVLFFGLTWYNNSNSKDLKELYEKDQLERSFEKYHFLNNLELLRVSKQGHVERALDYHSLEVFSNFSAVEGKDYLRGKLGYGNVTIQLYEYDDDGLEKKDNEITLYKNEPLEEIEVIGRNAFKNVLIVKNQVTGEQLLGVVNIITIQTK